MSSSGSSSLDLLRSDLWNHPKRRLLRSRSWSRFCRCCRHRRRDRLSEGFRQNHRIFPCGPGDVYRSRGGGYRLTAECVVVVASRGCGSFWVYKCIRASMRSRSCQDGDYVDVFLGTFDSRAELHGRRHGAARTCIFSCAARSAAKLRSLAPPYEHFVPSRQIGCLVA